MLSIIVLVSFLLQITSSIDIHDDNNAGEILRTGKQGSPYYSDANKKAIRDDSREELRNYPSYRGSSLYEFGKTAFGIMENEALSLKADDSQGSPKPISKARFSPRVGKRSSEIMLKSFSDNSYLDKSHISNLDASESEMNGVLKKISTENMPENLIDSDLNNPSLYQDSSEELTYYPHSSGGLYSFGSSRGSYSSGSSRFGKRASGVMQERSSVNSHLDNPHTVDLEPSDSEMHREFRKRSYEIMPKKVVNSYLIYSGSDEDSSEELPYYPSRGSYFDGSSGGGSYPLESSREGSYSFGLSGFVKKASPIIKNGVFSMTAESNKGSSNPPENMPKPMYWPRPGKRASDTTG